MSEEQLETRYALAAWLCTQADGAITLAAANVAITNSLSGVSATATTVSWTDQTGSFAVVFASVPCKLNILGGEATDNIDLRGLTTWPRVANEAIISVSGNAGDDNIWGPSDAAVLYFTCTFNGDADNDTIVGGSSWDTIYGETGSDTLSGNDGWDKIYGGIDVSLPGTWFDPSPDFIAGGAGNDLLHGGGGNDIIWGGDDDDEIDGEQDDDALDGDGGIDTIMGSAGFDEIDGGAENDLLYGGADPDTIHGGAGNDHIEGGSGGDTLDGGDDDDTIYSNDPAGADQQWGGAPPGLLLPDIKGSGGAGCDIEDGHVECAPRVGADGYGVDKNIGLVVNAGSLSPRDLVFNDAPMGDCDDPTEADEFTIVVTDQPDHGSVTLHVDANSHTDGGFTYTPTTSYVGTDTFKYVIENEAGASDEATVTLTITNSAPVATDFTTASMNFGYGNGVDITQAMFASHISDLNNDTLTVELYSGGSPQGGSVLQNGDGSFTFTSNTASGSGASFTYRVTDGTAYSDPKTITLTLNNPAVTAHDDTYAEVGYHYGTYTLYFGSVKAANGTGGVADNASWSTENVHFTFLTGPSSITLNGSTGEFSYGIPYSPWPPYSGPVSFTYQISDWNSTANATVNFSVAFSLSLNQAPLENSTAASVGEEQVRDLLRAAGDRWHDAGVSASTINAALGSVQIVVTNLPGSQLAAIAGNVLYVDQDAAGYGWFIDASPLSDNEFHRHGGELVAKRNSAAAGHVDLLSAMEHELGHLLGLEHSASPGNVMQAEIGLGVRRLPTFWDAALVELAYGPSGRRGG